MMMPILVYFLPVLTSDGLLSAWSVPPMMQRVSAIIVGSCMTWMIRLRRELAVARFVMRPDIPPVPAKALFSDRMCLETSSVLESLSASFV